LIVGLKKQNLRGGFYDNQRNTEFCRPRFRNNSNDRMDRLNSIRAISGDRVVAVKLVAGAISHRKSPSQTGLGIKSAIATASLWHQRKTG
jgi:hypothetical protein